MLFSFPVINQQLFGKFKTLFWKLLVDLNLHFWWGKKGFIKKVSALFVIWYLPTPPITAKGKRNIC